MANDIGMIHNMNEIHEMRTTDLHFDETLWFQIAVFDSGIINSWITDVSQKSLNINLQI